MDGPAFLDGLVASFTAILSGGYSRLSADLKEILSLMVGIDLMVASLAWAGACFELFTRFGMSVLKVFIWATIFFSYPVLSQSFVDFVVWGGLTAGGLASGSGLTVDEFRKPSIVAMKAFEATAPINKFIENHTGVRGIMGNAGTLLFCAVGAFFIWCAFIVITIFLILALLVLEVVLAFAVIFIVFGAFGPMAFLATQAFALIVASAVRLGVGALIVGLSFPYVDQFFLTPGVDPKADQVAWLVLGSVLIAAASIIVPSIAHSFFAGGPALGFGNLLPGYALARSFRGSGGGGGSTAGGSSGSPNGNSGASRPMSPSERREAGQRASHIYS